MSLTFKKTIDIYLYNIFKESIDSKNLIYIIGKHKTVDFILGIAKNIALTEKIPVAIFSFKHSKQALTQRLISLDSGIPLKKIKKARLNKREWSRFTQSAGRLSEAPIYIAETPRISASRLYKKASLLKEKQDIKIVILIL